MVVFLAFKTFDLVPKSVLRTFNLVPKYLALDRMHYSNFQSSEKSPKIQSSVIKTFDLVKKDNFDLVKFDLLTPSQNLHSTM
jgi:hypothetical protein